MFQADNMIMFQAWSNAWLGSATPPGVLCLGSAGSLAVPCLGSVCLVLTCSKRSKSGKGLETTTQPPSAAAGRCAAAVVVSKPLPLLDISEQVKDKADRAEARYSKRASRAKAEHSRRIGRAKPGNTLCKNNNTAAFGGCAAASLPQLLFLQGVLPVLALPLRLECSTLARLPRLLCLAFARSALS